MRNLWLVGVILTFFGCASAPQMQRVPAQAATADDTVADNGELVRLNLSAELSPGQTVEIDNPYGDGRLRFGGYEEHLEINAVAQQPEHASTIALEPGIVGERYVIAPRLPEGQLLAERQRLDLVVFVPIGHAVSVRTEQGLIESRGIRADIDLRSTSGDLAIRGTKGVISAETGAGSIEASLLSPPSGSHQRLATGTGPIVIAVNDKLDARLELKTSAAFATEFSLQIQQLPGQEPNKRAVALVGEDKASIAVESRRGEIRLLRWQGFTTADGKPVEEEEEMDSDSD